MCDVCQSEQAQRTTLRERIIQSIASNNDRIERLAKQNENLQKGLELVDAHPEISEFDDLMTR